MTGLRRSWAASASLREKIEKREGPTQDLVFLGLRYETNADGSGAMQITVPEDKLRKAEAAATELARRTEVTVRELQSAIGYFNHIAQAVYAARAFLRRLIHALRDAEAGGARRAPVTTAMRYDLEFWARFARQFNGTAVVLSEPVMSEGFFATDASDLGMGGFLEGRTFAVSWDGPEGLRRAGMEIPPAFRKYNKDKLWPCRDQPALWAIHYRELFAMWWPLLLWTEPCQLQNKTVTIHCDNAVARCDLNNGSAPNTIMMRLVRHILQFCAQHNIRLHIVAISSKANILADTLSRLDFEGYRKALADWEADREQGRGTFRPTYTRRVFRNPGLIEHEAEAAMASGTPLPLLVPLY